jgi:cell division septum initiation protein DivIVA
VSALQQEQQQLLTALSALEGSLLEARQATEDQRAACARAEELVQRKALAASEVRQELREAKQQAQQVWSVPDGYTYS